MQPGGKLISTAMTVAAVSLWQGLPGLAADSPAPKPSTTATTTTTVVTPVAPATPAATAPAGASSDTATAAAEAPVEKILLKPGKSLSINMATEDIVCTNDVELARKQRESYPDSPEASFIYAVALSRTSRVEDALKEVRRARKLAEKQGGPSYFDKMIETYENMLSYYPDDNQVRYHLAWAYYMKAYVLAKYSHLANTPQAQYKEWVASASATNKPKDTTNGDGSKNATDPNTAKDAAKDTSGNDVLKDMHTATSTISSATPQAVPAVKKYYQLATGKLDDLLARDPSDTWARVYRAFLIAEAGGDLKTAMAEWQKVRDEQPNNPAAYFFLGEGYLKQGNLKECLLNVSRAIALRSVGN